MSDPTPWYDRTFVWGIVGTVLAMVSWVVAPLVRPDWPSRVRWLFSAPAIGVMIAAAGAAAVLSRVTPWPVTGALAGALTVLAVAIAVTRRRYLPPLVSPPTEDELSMLAELQHGLAPVGVDRESLRRKLGWDSVRLERVARALEGSRLIDVRVLLGGGPWYSATPAGRRAFARAMEQTTE